jgi:Na+/H+-dicarboxylate symporter/ABC-type amino acid transport substrate-binding protein
MPRSLPGAYSVLYPYDANEHGLKVRLNFQCFNGRSDYQKLYTTGLATSTQRFCFWENCMKSLFSLSLSTRVLLGLALGIICGLLFGEKVAFLSTVGEAFIMLLQMAALPYIMLSLSAGIGSLSFKEALSYGKKCGAILLLLWGLTLVIVAALSLSFPDWKNASYFNTSLLDTAEGMNMLALYIPFNPFYSLANNIVPAVVVFSLAVGLALIGIDKKEGLIQHLNVLNEAIVRIVGFVVSLAPYGVFAIMATAAGTMSLEEFGRLQVYFIIYITFWLILTFWMLPALITSLTPLSYRDVLWHTKDALITAFATGNLLIVLPVLASRSKELVQKCNLPKEEAESAIDIIIPTSYAFPSAGKILSLAFILFAAWLSEIGLSLSQTFSFLITGLFSFFGSTMVAVPFLLDFLRIPSDLMQLFIISDAILSRFGVLAAGVHTLVLALLGTFAIAGAIKFRWKKLIIYCVVTVMLILCSLFATRLLFSRVITGDYIKYTEFIEKDIIGDRVTAKVKEPGQMPALTGGELQQPRLQIIRQRGSLRVGYGRDALPYVFKNTSGNLVGFDVDMAHQLARELGVTLEFVKIERANAAEFLNTGRCDIIMSGITITTDRMSIMAFSEAYMDTTLAFVVTDHRREAFESYESIINMDSLRLAITDVPYYIEKTKKLFPNASLTVVQSPQEFLENKTNDFDALVYVAEAGSAWTLVFPQYSIAIPYPNIIKIPLAYAVSLDDPQMLNFISTWVTLKKKDETIKLLYDYWILGKDPHRKKPRWCILRDVLGWMN